MRGRRVLMESLVSHGVRHIFGNPGTTETPLLDSLPAYPQIDYVMTLHEGVAVGAASFYAQATGRAAVANLHVAPGLGNAIGSLYGALKASSPLVVTAGQQDTRMRLTNPLLGHDLVAMAAPVTKWSVQVERADETRADPAPRLQGRDRCAERPGVRFAADRCDGAGDRGRRLGAGQIVAFRASGPQGRRGGCAALLLKSRSPAIMAGDDVARSGAEQALVALAEAIGASVWFEGLRHHASFPTGHPNYRQSLPGDAAQVRTALGDADLVLLLGGPFFEDIWYTAGSHFPDRRGRRPDRAIARAPGVQSSSRRRHRRRHGDQPCRTDEGGAFAGDARNSGWPRSAATRHWPSCARGKRKRTRPRLEKSWSREPSSMPRVTAELRRGLPDNVVIVDESITASLDLARVVRLSRLRRLFRRTRRRHRPGICRRDRRQGRDAGSPGRRRLRRRLGDVQHPGAVDRGAPQASRSCSSSWRTASTASSSTMWTSGVRISNAGTQHPYQHMDLIGPGARFRASRCRHGRRRHPGREGRRHRNRGR